MSTYVVKVEKNHSRPNLQSQQTSFYVNSFLTCFYDALTKCVVTQLTKCENLVKWDVVFICPHQTGVESLHSICMFDTFS